MNCLRYCGGDRVLFFAFTLVCATLMQGCVKDKPNANIIKLTAEKLNTEKAAKAGVRGDATYWVDGDKLWINGSSYDVLISDYYGRDAAASVDESVLAAGYVSAIYPYEAYVSGSGTDFTVRVPNEYYYKESTWLTGSLQVLDGLPMVAYYGGDNPENLEFKHITAAISVQVKNEKTGDSTLELDKIELTNSLYQLSGDVLVTLSDGAPVIKHDASHAIPYAQGSPSKVTLTFSGRKVRIAPGEARVFQIPILPVGSTYASMFTIKVTCHCDGRRFVYQRSTPARDNSIARACNGYAVTQITPEHKAMDLYDKIDDPSDPHHGYYIISSADDMVDLAEAMNHKWENTGDGSYHTSNYWVTNDIDLGGATIAPLHYYSAGCTFDGGNHTISDFTIDTHIQQDDQENLCGFFTCPEGENITVCNLTLENVNFDFSHADLKVIAADQYDQSCVGGIFGVVKKSGTVIRNCHVKNIYCSAATGLTPAEMGSETSHSQVDEYVGGIVGLCCESCTIENCTVTGVTIDNSMDAATGKIVDQFGGIVGRVNQNKNYTGNPGTSPKLVIKNCRYDQGSTLLEFQTNLQKMRCGGLIANVTKAGMIFLENDTVVFNWKINPLSGTNNEMYIGGLIGCNKSSNNWALHLAGNIFVKGELYNNAFTKYGAFQINRYICHTGNSTRQKCIKYDYDLSGNSESSLEYCNTPSDLFHVTGKTTKFKYPYQSLFDNYDGAASDSRPTPGAKSRKK